jgi:hypothetical protein
MPTIEVNNKPRLKIGYARPTMLVIKSGDIESTGMIRKTAINPVTTADILIAIVTIFLLMANRNCCKNTAIPTKISG